MAGGAVGMNPPVPEAPTSPNAPPLPGLPAAPGDIGPSNAPPLPELPPVPGDVSPLGQAVALATQALLEEQYTCPEEREPDWSGPDELQARGAAIAAATTINGNLDIVDLLGPDGKQPSSQDSASEPHPPCGWPVSLPRVPRASMTEMSGPCPVRATPTVIGAA